jgi:methylated-DNA-[protein]-cysteine S-methyltransferase
MLYKKIVGSPVGRLTIVASDTGILAVMFKNQDAQNDFKEATESKNHPLLLRCEAELSAYFRGELSQFSVPLEPEGTKFQLEAWSALQEIPYGTTESYSQQAGRMGKKKSVRAVAAANGQNPISIIIPCHRVIASSGRLHGYAGGLHIKRKLLEIEGIRFENSKELDADVAR